MFKLNVNYCLAFILAFFIIFNLLIKPNIFEKIEGYNILTELESHNVNSIELIRLKRNDKNGKVQYLKEKYTLKSNDSLEMFLTEIKNGKAAFSQRVESNGFRWQGKIILKDSIIFYINLIQNGDNVSFTPYYKNGVISFYRNNSLSVFLDSLSQLDSKAPSQE